MEKDGTFVEACTMPEVERRKKVTARMIKNSLWEKRFLCTGQTPYIETSRYVKSESFLLLARLKIFITCLPHSW